MKRHRSSFIKLNEFIDACSPLSLALALKLSVTTSLHFRSAELVVAPFHAAWSIV